jgi:hypothetical protein
MGLEFLIYLRNTNFYRSSKMCGMTLCAIFVFVKTRIIKSCNFCTKHFSVTKLKENGIYASL